MIKIGEILKRRELKIAYAEKFSLMLKQMYVCTLRPVHWKTFEIG